MLKIKNACVIAIDGGGTRCRLALECASRKVRVEVGPANVTTDFKGAVSQLILGLNTLAWEAGYALETIAQFPAYLGLAGYRAERDQERLSQALPLHQVKIEDDRPGALRGALGSQNGALVHSGTGSFYGVKTNEGVRFGGGWGAILGDEGSAAWFGKNALSRTLDAEDGTRERSAVTKALVDHFGSASGILAFANEASPADFGALVPMILEFDDDPIVRALSAEAAIYFDTGLQQFGWRDGEPVCLTGGLAPRLATSLTEIVRRNLIPARGNPLDGAVALAREFAEECV